MECALSDMPHRLGVARVGEQLRDKLNEGRIVVGNKNRWVIHWTPACVLSGSYSAQHAIAAADEPPACRFRNPGGDGKSIAQNDPPKKSAAPTTEAARG